MNKKYITAKQERDVKMQHLTVKRKDNIMNIGGNRV